MSDDTDLDSTGPDMRLYMSGSFCLPMNDNARIVKCPLCGGRVGYYDGKGQIDVYTACRRCHVGVLFLVRGRFTLVRPWPDVQTTSGKRLL